jgi:hypothetical protein
VLSYARTAKAARTGWKDLVSGLQPIHLKGLEMVARDFLEPSRDQLKLEPEEIWGLVGGWEGIKRIRRNAEIMLDLAAYTQRWNFEEGVIVTERMRRDGRNLRSAARRLQLQMAPQHLHILPKTLLSKAPFEVHEIASAYYLMRQRLLAVYETSHAGLYPVLAASL